DEVAATAAVTLAGLAGERQASLEAGMDWARPAEALIRRAKLSSALTGALLRSKARLLRNAGRLDAARTELEAALVAQRSAPAADDLEVVALLRELAGVALDQRRPDEAAELVEQSLEHAAKALGMRHPEVGRAHLLLGVSQRSA